MVQLVWLQLRDAIHAVQYTWCKFCGAIYVVRNRSGAVHAVQSMWCKLWGGIFWSYRARLRGVSDVVQAIWCKLGGAIYVIQAFGAPTRRPRVGTGRNLGMLPQLGAPAKRSRAPANRAPVRGPSGRLSLIK